MCLLIFNKLYLKITVKNNWILFQYIVTNVHLEVQPCCFCLVVHHPFFFGIPFSTVDTLFTSLCTLDSPFWLSRVFSSCVHRQAQNCPNSLLDVLMTTLFRGHKISSLYRRIWMPAWFYFQDITLIFPQTKARFAWGVQATKFCTVAPRILRWFLGF